MDQLLAYPKLPLGTRLASASADYESVVVWGIKNELKFVCFNTASGNSRMKNDACIFLQQKMEMDMIWLECRHHILEIILERVVFLFIGLSKSPDITILKQFQVKWSIIDKTRYQVAVSNDVTIVSPILPKI